MDATLKILKSVHFVLQISPRKHSLQEKWSIPQRIQRKILRKFHLNFLFLKLCHRDFLSQSNVKNHDFIKKSLQFSIFLEHPLVYVKQIWVF